MNKRGYVGNVRFFYFNDDGKLKLFHIFQKKSKEYCQNMCYHICKFTTVFLLCIHGKYSWHDMLAQPYTFGEIIYSTKTASSQLSKFMLALVCICLSWYIFVGAGKIANILQ